ncbi:MAG: hypothetical protein JNK87_01995, partial [Bryobacterales bacterium]|nr:hypothetical protein [Bryobacterales bacterium]
MRLVVAGLLGVAFCSAQTTDWKALFDGLTSPDPVVSGAARGKSQTLLAAMMTADAASLVKDLAALS